MPGRSAAAARLFRDRYRGLADVPYVGGLDADDLGPDDLTRPHLLADVGPAPCARIYGLVVAERQVTGAGYASRLVRGDGPAELLQLLEAGDVSGSWFEDPVIEIAFMCWTEIRRLLPNGRDRNLAANRIARIQSSPATSLFDRGMVPGARFGQTRLTSGCPVLRVSPHRLPRG